MLVERLAAEGVPVPAEVVEVLDPEVLQPGRPQAEPVYPHERAPHGEVWQPPPPRQHQPDGQAVEDALEVAEQVPEEPAEALPEEDLELPEPEPDPLADVPFRSPYRRRRGEVADVRWQTRDQIRRAQMGR
jgi:hypothetical protein